MIILDRYMKCHLNSVIGVINNQVDISPVLQQQFDAIRVTMSRCVE